MPAAQAGRLLRGVRVLVALKMERVIETIARTMRLQLKFTPQRMNLTTLTLVFVFYIPLVSSQSNKRQRGSD